MNTPLQNDRYLRALRRQSVDRTPIWVMRQAGRYLPEYRATRARAGSFIELCHNHDLCCEVTLQPLDRFGLDAAIMFSDILTVPDAMGLGLYFSAGEGPKFERPVRTAADIDALPVPDPELDLGYVMKAVSTISKALAGRVPLIGFTGSPWTLATYMVEGGSSRDFPTIKGMMYAQPELLDRLLGKLSDAVSAYLLAQVANGAQSLMMFDTWGGVLNDACYQRFSLQPMQRIVAAIKAAHPDVPITLFTKGGGRHLETMAATGCDALGIDWTQPLAEARQRVGNQVALQGNLDPCVLYADPDTIRAEVAATLAAFGAHTGHVFNLGHGIHPAVPPEHMQVLVDAVHELSPAYHD